MQKGLFLSDLNNYFDFHVCLSISLPSSVRLPCVRNLTPLPAVLSQNVTNKSFLVCVKSEKYAYWVTLRPQQDLCRRGEAEVRILDFKTTWSEFHHLTRVGPKQLCALAHLGCTRAAGTSQFLHILLMPGLTDNYRFKDMAPALISVRL